MMKTGDMEPSREAITVVTKRSAVTHVDTLRMIDYSGKKKMRKEGEKGL